MGLSLPLKGRGTAVNPANRFEPLHYQPDPDAGPEEAGPRTRVFKDSSRTILVRNDSPDVPFAWSLNPYRGCEHGCSYCYARPFHEYLGLSAGLDFETQLFAKTDAPALFRQELLRPRWLGETVAFSGVTDCYQPIERSLRLTRDCLEVAAEFRQPVGIVTKNRLVTRDADLLADLARHAAAAVAISITTLDEELARTMEPRASTIASRLEAIRELTAAGIPVAVMVAPVIPGLTEHEIPGILAAARDAGATAAGMVLLRLPHAVKEIFSAWLADHHPDRRTKVLGRVRAIRGGKLNDPNFRSRMTGTGPLAELIQKMFRLHRRRLGLAERLPPLSSAHFRRPGPRQGSLFG